MAAWGIVNTSPFLLSYSTCTPSEYQHWHVQVSHIIMCVVEMRCSGWSGTRLVMLLDLNLCTNALCQRRYCTKLLVHPVE